jgi:hypothetical protein
VPVLSELTFHGLQAAFGDRGLLAAQLVAITFGLAVVAWDARRAGATDAGTAAAVALLVPAGLLAFAGIKAQLFSLALFPLLVALLRVESRRPSRRIWLVVPLVALWSNLHGAVLVGLAVVVVYLAFDRMRFRAFESLGFGVAGVLALCATPALERTPRYYLGVATSEAAKRGYGLWAPLTWSSGFDLLLVAGAAMLLVAFVRTRPRLWEIAAAALLTAATVHTARNGIWLLLFLAPRAASAVAIRGRLRPLVAAVLTAALAIGVVLGFVRGPLGVGASERLIRQAIATAQAGPILAEPAAAEQIEEAGGRVWISNPLDAFRRADQRAYVDWLQGRRSGDRPLRQARVVVASTGSPGGRRLSRNHEFSVVAAEGSFRVFLRSR